MIQIKNVTKLYPAKAADIESGNGNPSSGSGVIRALDDISLHVEPGEWLSIMGPSGSGKSTLVNLIGCLDRPSAGEVWLDGQNVAGISSNELDRVRAEKIGFVFQQFHLIPFLTAVENVMLAQYFHSITDENEAAGALRRVGLGDRLEHLPAAHDQVPPRVVAARLVVRHAQVRSAALALDQIHDAAQPVALRQGHLRLDAARIVLGIAREPVRQLEGDRLPPGLCRS